MCWWWDKLLKPRVERLQWIPHTHQSELLSLTKILLYWLYPFCFLFFASFFNLLKFFFEVFFKANSRHCFMHFKLTSLLNYTLFNCSAIIIPKKKGKQNPSSLTSCNIVCNQISPIVLSISLQLFCLNQDQTRSLQYISRFALWFF